MIRRNDAPYMITESVFWLGSLEKDSLKTNIYMIYRDGRAILIDPGPRSAFKETLKAVQKVCPPESLTAMVLSEREPDICSSLPAWEEWGFQGRLLAHKSIAPLIESFGLVSPLIPVNGEGGWEKDAATGLVFIPLSLKHYPGTLLTYDPLSQTLFTSHLFGAYGERDLLYADESYYRGIGGGLRDLLSPLGDASAVLAYLESLPIKRICPQHGCIITEDPDRYLALLKENLPFSDKAGEEDEWEQKQFALNEELVLSSDEKLRDPVTGLYNGIFFHTFLPSFIEEHPRGTVSCLRLDNMKGFNNAYGFHEGDRAIATFASLMQTGKREDAFLFREAGPTLFFMLPDGDAREHREILESLQNRVRESRDFVQEVTCSVAAVRLDELPGGEENPVETVNRILRHRLQILDVLGPHSLCLSSDRDEEIRESLVLLIIDSDPLCSRLLVDYFELRNCTVHLCADGGDALHLIDLYRPHFVISEIKVPQMDGYRIRERMLQSHDLRHIPFLFLSHLKTEDSVERAQKLGVLHYLKKPVMLSELWGIVRSLSGKED